MPASPQDFLNDDAPPPVPIARAPQTADTLRPFSVEPRAPAPVATTRVTQDATSDRRWMFVAAGFIFAFGVVGAIVNLSPGPRANASAGMTSTVSAPAHGPVQVQPSAAPPAPVQPAPAPETTDAPAPLPVQASRDDASPTIAPAKPVAKKPPIRARRTTTPATADDAPQAAPPRAAPPRVAAKPVEAPKPEAPAPPSKQKAIDTLEKAMSETSL
ncbi:MAG: hypothetical protein KF819_14050 [Labilithrix sp.]|nr:hypothetical protein [Labilithrix sp.]